MFRRLTSNRRVLAEIGAAAGLAAIALAASMLWSTKGLAVYLETIAAGIMTCF